MQGKPGGNRARQGTEGTFTCFPPAVPEQANHGPSPLCSQLRTVREQSGTDGLQCEGQVQVWLCGVNGMVFYQAVWPADRVPPGLRRCLRSCLPGPGCLPGVWCSFSLSSVAVPMTCLPVCLLRGKQPGCSVLGQRRQNPKQIKERGGTCPSGAGSLPIHVAWLSGRATPTAFFPGSLVPPSLQMHRQGTFVHPARRAGQDCGVRGGQTFRPPPLAARRCSQLGAFTPTRLLWLWRQEGAKGG